MALTAPLPLNQLDRDVIDAVLGMGGGFVLDFSDRTFADFFRDFGISIDDEEYRIDGQSKAKRLRAFLRTAQPALVGRVLNALLDHKELKVIGAFDEPQLTRYRAIVERLGGVAAGSKVGSQVEPESELLKRVFKPEVLARLPLDDQLSKLLAARMYEAHACIDGKASLAAVILCGSVLEGLCLGVGSSDPERVNRGYASQYRRTAPPFHEWKLREWIEVLGRLGDLSPNVEKFGQALRDFRNYVHPAEQLANRFSPDQHTARIGFHVVVAAIEDLARAAASKEKAT